MKVTHKIGYFLSFLLIILIISCSQKDNLYELKTFKVVKSDFVNKVTVTGIIEATKTYSITSPRIWIEMKISYLVPEGTIVSKGDTVCILKADKLENDYEEAMKNLETKKSDYEKAVAEYNLQKLIMETQLKTNESSTKISYLDSSKLAFTSPVERKLIELELEKSAVEREKIINEMNYFEIINKAELKKVEMEIRQAENNVARQEGQLDKLVLTSGTAGLVTYARSWITEVKVREGDTVWPRMPIIIIPDLSDMQTKLTVNEAHFKRIEKGQELNITIDAFAEINLTGKIKFKKPMGKPVRRDSQVKVFEIISTIDSSGFAIQPGLSITADVILESIPDTVIVPLSAVFEHDSLNVVYVTDDDEITRRSVKVAGRSENYAVISEGLKPGAEIVLIEPPQYLIAERNP
jgi:RND family efflux transporter MFP subunit